MCDCHKFGLAGIFDGPAPPPPPSLLTPDYAVYGLPAALQSAPPVVPPVYDSGLPANMLSVKFADGSMGFLDPTDGTYYDDQGDDITGYVNNFGGAQVLGPASAAQIAAANGVALPAVIPPASPAGAAPRVSATPTLATTLAPAAATPYATYAIAAGLGLLVMSMMGGKKR
jgi:hypothetical protein